MPQLSPTSPISHLSLSVRDAEATAAFWQELLGIPRLDTVESDTWRAVFLALSDHVVIEFQEHRANPGEPFDPTRTGFDHLGLRVDSLPELQSWQARLEELGVEHTPIVTHDYGRGPMHVLTFKDPDRLQFEFFHWPAHP